MNSMATVVSCLCKIIEQLHLDYILQNQSPYFKINIIALDKLQGRRAKALKITKDLCFNQAARVLKELVLMTEVLIKIFINSKNKENKFKKKFLY